MFPTKCVIFSIACCNSPDGVCGRRMVFQSNNDFAGPDYTGRELFRSVAHADLDLYTNRVVLYGDVNMFTD